LLKISGEMRIAVKNWHSLNGEKFDTYKSYLPSNIYTGEMEVLSVKGILDR